MHTAPYENMNQPIVNIDHPLVPLVYLRIPVMMNGQSVRS
jgi:hypothetical protein